MRFEWKSWDFVKEYLLRVLGLWLTILSAFSLVMHLIIKFWLGKDIPVGYWIVVVVIGVIIAQSVAYYRIARRQIPGERIENDLESISNLRAEGVNTLLNVDTSTINTAEDLKTFHGEFLQWRDKVILEIKKVSPSQASIFQVLGLVKYGTSIEDYRDEVKKGLEKTLGEIADYTCQRLQEFFNPLSERCFHAWKIKCF